MVMNETEFPKADGDTFYGKDTRKVMDVPVFDNFEQETLSVSTTSASASYSSERDSHIIKNVGSETCYINFDATATTNDWELKSSETLEIDTNCTKVHAITSSGTTTLRMIGFS